MKMSVKNSSGDVRKVFSSRRHVQPGDVNLYLVGMKVLKAMTAGRLHWGEGVRREKAAGQALKKPNILRLGEKRRGNKGE